MTYRRYASEGARITENVNVTPAGCWEWQQFTDAGGYGRIQVEKKLRYTHRFSYETFVGPIPEGRQIDHLCRNRRCCNPEHLQPVTPAMNTHRGESFAAGNAAKRKCKAGHEFTAANTYIDKRGCRVCRPCRRARLRAFYQRHERRRAAAKAA